LGPLRHPMTKNIQIMQCIKLVRGPAFKSLPSPVPRCQDLSDDSFDIPSSASDLVIATSHAWRNQVHPDVHGTKLKSINRLLDEAGIQETRDQRVLHFFDFASITQRPFQAGQADRSVSELATFKSALFVMHNVYFLADRIVHLASEHQSLRGEGDVFHVRAKELKHFKFAQVGAWVQLAPSDTENTIEVEPVCARESGRSNTSMNSTNDKMSHVGSLMSHQMSHAGSLMSHVVSSLRGNLPNAVPKSTCGAFDCVEAVGDEAIVSVGQLVERLESASADMVVTLRRFPFGRVNDIPADDRGWVFLERFITMVKCAMLDPESAQKVVLTNSDAILRQIHDGANHLRRASEKDEQTGRSDRKKLQQVLGEFVAELKTKRFSAASTDKLQIDSKSKMTNAPSDLEVVEGIMEEFVTHLSFHWHSDAARQQKRAKIIGDAMHAAAEFILKWDGFSRDYDLLLVNADSLDPSPMIWFFGISTALALGLVMWPHGRPDAMWGDNLGFWMVFCVGTFVIISMFPRWLWATVVGYSQGFRLRQHMISIVWAFVTTFCIEAVIFSLAYSLDVFPLPLTTYVAVGVCSVFLPALWWLIPSDMRAERNTLWRLLYSILSILSIMAIFGFAFPAVYALVKQSDGSLQFVYILLLFFARLLFEGTIAVLFKYLGADVMPLAIFCGVGAYEITVGMCLTTSAHWSVVVELVLFDLLENIYYVWSLRRIIAQEDTGMQKQRRRVVVILMVRQFLQVLVPVWYLLVQFAAYHWQPTFNTIVSEMTPDGYRWATQCVLINLAIECIVFVVTCKTLQRLGDRPLHLLCAVVKVNFVDFLFAFNPTALYLLMVQHSHWGVDTTFQFAWVGGGQKQWIRGLTWEGAGN